MISSPPRERMFSEQNCPMRQTVPPSSILQSIWPLTIRQLGQVVISNWNESACSPSVFLSVSGSSVVINFRVVSGRGRQANDVQLSRCLVGFLIFETSMSCLFPDNRENGTSMSGHLGHRCQCLTFFTTNFSVVFCWLLDNLDINVSVVLLFDN